MKFNKNWRETKVGKGHGANPTFAKTKTWLSYSSIEPEVHESRERYASNS